MKLHVLGSGSCVIRQEHRAACGYAVETDAGTVLVDTGPGTSRNLARAGLDTSDIIAVLHTHRHSDHVSDIGPIIQDVYVDAVNGEPRSRDLLVAGPAGHPAYLDSRLKHEVEATTDALSVECSFDITVAALEPGEVLEHASFTVTPVDAAHGGDGFPCLSLRLAVGEQVIAFTGDTGYVDRLVELADGADLLVTDCSTPDGQRIDGHMTPSDGGRIAAGAGVDTLLLSHFYPAADDVDVVSQAATVFDGRIVAADDLLTVDL